MNDNSRSNKWKFNLWQPNEASNDGNNSTDVEVTQFLNMKPVNIQSNLPARYQKNLEEKGFLKNAIDKKAYINCT